MASALNKLSKLEEQLEQARREAASEVAELLMATGAYALGATKLKRLLQAAAKAQDEDFDQAIQTLKGSPTSPPSRASASPATA